MRVVHVGEDCKGGVHTYLKNVIDYQIKDIEIEEILLVISENSLDFQFDSNKVKIIKYKYKRNIKGILRAMFAIHNEISSFSPNIVHVHSTFAGFFVRIPLFFIKYNYEIIYCAHGWSFSMQGNIFKKKMYATIEKILSVKTTKIINISSYDHKESSLYKLKKNKCVLINNGSNESFIVDKLKSENDKSKKMRLLFVGRFDKQKGIDILLDVFSKYSFPDIELYLVGYSVRHDVKFKVPSNVFLIGEVSNDEIDKYYLDCDAVIIPSRWEGFGLVAIEGMKNKKALIVSDRGALPDFINNHNGYIFRLDDLESLVTILKTLNKDTLKEMGHRGRELYLNFYTADKMNVEIKKLYNKILSDCIGDTKK